MFGQEQFNKPSRFLKNIPGELMDQGQGAWGKGQGLVNHVSNLPLSPHNLSSVTSVIDDIESIPEPSEENDGVYLGMKVRHGKFGVGTVRRVEGEGDGQKIIVWFNSVGPKKLMLRFAGLERA